ncbi:unnamed protein product [Ostreobium quekettii]|uniref:NADH dehydrogenase [ubiquinone] 1 alpha subcomplex subunit 12 n=1 Tax=Ostreobium quekettii TaxID=121088 RepID=A0A8S1IR76_9CHLO|nr:unnamed protein product [Ostreobium quekettii]|eukprot:evm.model.scf_695.2 EVM.evm.TU.scf_695.2   scf_695:20153-23362(+)
MPSGLSGLSRIVEGVKRLVLRRELVGVDSLGNKYFRKAEVLNGRPFERRWVSPVRGEYDPGSIPPEWTSWLHKGRADPPQEEESMRLEASRLAMQKKVEALEEEERKRKFRMESLRLQGQQADSEPSMTRFVEQLATKGSSLSDPSLVALILSLRQKPGSQADF